MEIYVYECETSNDFRFSAKDKGEGFYAEYHEATGMPYGDSFFILRSVWDVPESYELEGGTVMVPFGDGHVTWNDLWPKKPKGSKKIREV